VSIYLLDTNILLGVLRTSPFAIHAEQDHKIFHQANFAFISVITIGEMRSLAMQLNWGEDRKEKLERLIRKVPHLDINKEPIMKKYAEIDAFNLGRHPRLQLEGSARKVGDNDCWIAATASAVNARLITTDHDFDHLNGVFLDVIWVDPQSA
jgi:predicted nucleic acid-binding protein